MFFRLKFIYIQSPITCPPISSRQWNKPFMTFYEISYFTITDFFCDNIVYSFPVQFIITHHEQNVNKFVIFFKLFFVIFNKIFHNLPIMYKYLVKISLLLLYIIRFFSLILIFNLCVHNKFFNPF